MHLEALEVNRQGERFSGLGRQKSLFLLNLKQLQIYHPVSPNKSKYTVSAGPQMWLQLVLLCPRQARPCTEISPSTTTELFHIHLKRGLCFHLGAPSPF